MEDPGVVRPFSAGGCRLTREVRLDLAVVVSCVEGLELREEKRGRPGDCFRRPKTSNVCPAIMPL